jgi:hypothetical protein
MEWNPWKACYFRNFVNGPTTICKDSLENFFDILLSSACGRAVTTDISHLLKQLNHSYTRFTHVFVLKSFLEYCDSSSCSFSQKESKPQTHSFFKISHFNFKNITKCTCKHLEKMPEKITQSAKCNVTWQTSSEYQRLMVSSGRNLNYISLRQKMQIPEKFGSHLVLAWEGSGSLLHGGWHETDGCLKLTLLNVWFVGHQYWNYP